MGEADSDIAIIGAGPIGLEAGLAAGERGADFTILEAAERPGGYVREWDHVRTFTPWRMSVSGRARAALGEAAPGGEELPSGADLIERLIEPLAASPALAGRIQLGARVSDVGREGLLKHEEIGTEERASRPFRLLIRDADGGERIGRAATVIDCSGTYGTPNRLGDGGIDAPGERAFDDRIARRLPDFGREGDAWAGSTTLLTGSGHSAQTAARSLAELAAAAPETRVIWAVRRADPDWGAVDADPLPERAELNAAAEELRQGGSPAVKVLTGVVTVALEPRGKRIAVSLRNGAPERVEVDRVLALNGGVGDHSIYRQLQVHECYASSAPMNLSAALLAAGGGGDCLAQTCLGAETLLNPEPGFFILGAKSYGRNSQFLMSIGWAAGQRRLRLPAGLSGGPRATPGRLQALASAYVLDAGAPGVARLWSDALAHVALHRRGSCDHDLGSSRIALRRAIAAGAIRVAGRRRTREPSIA